MIEFFVKRPVTTIMFVLFFVVLGIVSYFNLNVEKDPEIDFPIVTVSVVYPGATPLEVETLVTDKIEDAVSELSQIKKLRSYSYDSFSFIFVEFKMSADVNVKSIEVKDKVEAILNDLPGDAEAPVIEKFDPLIEPVLDLVLTSDVLDGRDLYEYADKTLKDHFSNIDGVANVDIYGGKKRQVNVVLDPALMKKYYITIFDVIREIKTRNKNIPGGLLEKGENSLSVRFVGEFEDVEEISAMMLTSRDGFSFPLNEIATVEDGFKEIETIARFNGRDAVGLSLEKVSDGNAINISKEVRRQLDDFRDMLPAGVDLEIASDTTDFILKENRSTQWNILLGIILTIIILYLFTGRIKVTFISTIIIPASIVSTLFLMDISQLTLNSMTLLAIATSLGTLIANAIVIIENVLVHVDAGEESQEAAINGTKEVASAVLASAGTNLVVFTPIAFMQGLVGQFMLSFGLTVVFATIFSLIASFSLTPMLCALMLKKGKEQRKDQASKLKIFNPFVALSNLTNKGVVLLKSEYKKIFDFMFRFPKSTLLVVLVIFLSIKFILPFVGNDFYPPSDEDKFKINIVLPQGTTVEKTLDVAKEIERIVKSVPEMKSYLTFVGDNGVENASITVDLVSSDKRKRSDIEIVNTLIPLVSDITDADINFRRQRRGPTDEGDISINLYGVDYNKMIELSKQAKKIMEKSGYFRSVVSSYKVPRNEVRFVPNQEMVKTYDLVNVGLGVVLRSSIYGDDSNVYKENGEEYDINVVLDEKYIENFEDLNQINIITKKGLFPITHFGSLSKSRATPMIRHREKRRVIRLEGYLAKSSTGFVMEQLDKVFDREIKFDKGYGYRYVGSSEYQEESQRETMKAFCIAVILTYMLLCAIMNSFSYPLVIITSIATSFVGAFLMLFFLGESINLASMLGLVMIVGLVVNNSILLLDHAIVKIKEGVPIKQAIWLGASEKFRSILMTSIAIILGLVPQLGALVALKTSMGTVVIGGMLASIFFTFILIPILFWYVARPRKCLDQEQT
ncbi:MAG: efflux RND transporter permease subunit [Candidatus Aceula lacicola]|nr:efflux RND transporter permease subunit [Candidatus Aceula lacicola]